MRQERAVGVERVTAERAAGILGVPLRTVQAMAAQGKLPSAAKLAGRWTFDEITDHDEIGRPLPRDGVMP